MATKQIQANPQNSNPITEAVIALRGVANRFKGADKEFETLFTVCLDGVEKEKPSYEQSLIWHDAFLYLAENDPNLRRGAIVESIARRMLSAYEDDYLPQPPQNDPPFSSDFNKVDPIGEKHSAPTPTKKLEQPLPKSVTPEHIDEDGNLILCNVPEVSCCSLPRSLRHYPAKDAIKDAQGLLDFLREFCTAMDGNRGFVFENWPSLSLILDLIQDKMEIGAGIYQFPLSDYTNDAPALIRRQDW